MSVFRRCEFFLTGPVQNGIFAYQVMVITQFDNLRALYVKVLKLITCNWSKQGVTCKACHLGEEASKI